MSRDNVSLNRSAGETNFGWNIGCQTLSGLSACLGKKSNGLRVPVASCKMLMDQL